MDDKDMGTDLKSVLITKEEIDAKLAELAAKIDAEYAGKDLLIVGVLKGAVMVMADLARALSNPVTMDWMAVSSYGAGTQSSGVVRILKDLDTDIKGKHVLIVEDIIDSGLTLSWLLSNLGSREPASLNVVTLLRKPEAAKVAIDVKWVGFDIPNEFVVGLRSSTSRRSTATCPSWAPSRRTSTAADSPLAWGDGPCTGPRRPPGTLRGFPPLEEGKTDLLTVCGVVG
ncbi:hypothetical protein GCM10020221_24780 [Streptomyces thioluteus]|uniref:Hypoxanthine phosphoribosyltransferase n=1 Tax=Streptomyces thioluteus TaxID=66431 RepID=A0ABP6JBF5_STRTU